MASTTTERFAAKEQPHPVPARTTASRFGGPRTLILALLASIAIAAVATPLGSLLPIVGAPIVALALGMAIATARPSAGLRPGLSFASRYVLQTAIVVLGATIDLRAVARVGIGSVPVMLGSLAAALLTATVAGRMLRVPVRLRVLLGVGTGICGASAIAAVSGIVQAREKELSYAISTIFVFNLIAVLLFIPTAHVLGMDQHQFGLWDGTAVNDVSSVVAAGFAYGHVAGSYALIVKLTRTMMIVPIALALAHLRSRRSARSRLERSPVEDGIATAHEPDERIKAHPLKLIPWFLLWFLVASAADTLGVWGSGARTDLSHAGLALTTVALAAVGLSSDLREARSTGGRPLLLGALVWIAVSLTSLGLQQLTGAA